MIAALAVVGAATLYTAYWYAAAYQMRTAVDAWVAEQRQRNLYVDIGQPEIEGFPGWLRLRVARPELEASGSWNWQSAPIEARSRPWHPWSIAFDGRGRHRITIVEPEASRSFTIDAAGLSGRVVAGGGGGEVRSFDLNLRALVVTTAQSAESLTIADAALKMDLPTEPALNFELELAELELPTSAATPLGSAFAAVTLRGQLSKLAQGEDWPDALQSWRDRGGVIEVTHVAVRHGPLNASGEGTIALDAEMQPVAAFTVRAEGYFETVDALQKVGLIKAGDVTGTKLVLAVLAKRRGSVSYIEAPLTVQGRKLRIGPLDLLRFPFVRWR